jgi:phosphatidylglycerol---prolipoprotein diacylglyceryl transferase
MYPNLYFACKDLFGVEWGFLRFINTFGFFVALSFIFGTYTLFLELKRREKQGLLISENRKIIVGERASFLGLLINFIFGFAFGYKFVGLFLSSTASSENIHDFIFSFNGSWLAGLLFAFLFTGLKWREKEKKKLQEPIEKEIQIWPSDRIGEIVFLAFLFGFIGAKLFNAFETWNDFVKDPIGSIFAFSGLTFYGGLICAALAIWYFAKKHHIGFWTLNDCAAPGLMLAYGIGRLGCQISGDGDWGIINSAYSTTSDGKVALSTPFQYQEIAAQNSNFYNSVFGSIDKIPHLSFKGFSILPNWFFAYPYPHNTINEGVQMVGCTGQFCNQLPLPVFPTPLYEVIICISLFFLIWSLRNRITIPGKLFGFYLLLNGVERFFIEKIRINSKYDLFGFHPTQAELISFLLIITGVCILLFCKSKQSDSKEMALH